MDPSALAPLKTCPRDVSEPMSFVQVLGVIDPGVHAAVINDLRAKNPATGSRQKAIIYGDLLR